MKRFLILYATVLTLTTTNIFANEPVIFSVMGDVPRSEKEDVLLQKQVKAHNEKSPAQFMVHVGDIKSGKTPCDEAVFAKVSSYLKELKIPKEDKERLLELSPSAYIGIADRF